jgi:hypothetical protein
MQTMQERLTFWLRGNRTIYFCDECLALKLEALPHHFPPDTAITSASSGDGLRALTAEGCPPIQVEPPHHGRTTLPIPPTRICSS